jgi:Diguanylate cyclase, GGDEF domain
VDHAEDAGVSERIEAFLDNRPSARQTRRRQPKPDAARRPTRPAKLDTRPDWDAALHHEDARVARYGRPASVLVVGLDVGSGIAAERAVPALAVAIRAAARETDRVARVGPARFHILLPETEEAEAGAVAERIRSACGETPMHVASASPARGQTLLDALALAVARVERAIGEGRP